MRRALAILAGTVTIGGAAYVLFRYVGVLYESGSPVGIAFLRKLDGVPLTLKLYSVVSRMKADAAAVGITLRLTSGFRSMTRQKRLYAEYTSGARKDVVALPGYSKHQSGRALDFEVHRSVLSAEYTWLDSNAAKYGLARTVASEPWHWEVSA